MRRVTSAFLTATCLCGSALAQPGTLPQVVGGQFPGNAEGGGLGADVRGGLSSRAPIGLPSRTANWDHIRPDAQFETGGDLRPSSGGGFGQRDEDGLSVGAQAPAERRHPHSLHPGLEARAASRAQADQAFDPETGGLTESGRAELMLRNRLAAIDRLRNAALEHGDSELLDEADRLEAQARAKFESRHRIAGPSHSAVHTAEFESSHPVSGVTQTSGHPIGGFDADSTRHRTLHGREFGVENPADAAAQGHEFGGASSTARSGETGGYGAARSPARPAPGEWYDVRGQQRTQSPQPAENASRYGARLDSRGSAPADFHRPQFDARPDLDRPTSGEVHFDPNPFTPPARSVAPADRGGSLDASADSAAGVSRDAFQRHLAAESRLRGSVPARQSAALGADYAHPLGSEEPRIEHPVHPLSYEAEDENTIYFGRQATPAAATEFGQNIAAEPRAGRHDFGQATAADAGRGREFGLPTAAEARARSREFGQATAAEAQFDREFGRARDFGQATAAPARAGGRDFGQMIPAGAEARARSSAIGGASLFPHESAAATAQLEGTADAEVGGDLPDGERTQTNEPASSRTEKPRKRGIFSWFRGRGQAESR